MARNNVNHGEEGFSMIRRIALALSIATSCLAATVGGRAQDVPGIEICTVEKTLERRTSCLQSNIEFLQKTISRLAADHRQKLDAAKTQIESLKATVISLQKLVDDLQAAQKKTTEEPKKADTPPTTKDVPAAKEGTR
jgi:hypothetical protein